jgi:hypothetical protein
MTAALLAVVLAGGLEERAPRLAPPAAVTCPRDQLTSYTGRVISYRRTAKALSLTIRTDWDTTENVRLAPPRLDKLRVGGVPFTAKDWTRIEAAPGELQPAVRATAWVCNDRRPPVIDWQPADSSSKPE